MFVFVVILSLVASNVQASWPHRISAASNAQIRFAIENKYDTTGPGAKTPEYAYKTYQTLDEALVAFADDPDTQLPEHEKNRVLEKLTKPFNELSGVTPIQRYKAKTVDEYTGYKPPVVSQNEFYGPHNAYNFRVNDIGLLRNERPKDSGPFKFQKYYSVKESPLSISHYSKPLGPVQHPRVPQEEFDDNPQYSFSYGVHDKGTGDSKSAHETRDGGTVRGFYTFMDADGKQRTVHYTADDKLGFRASVQRSHTNTQ